MASDEDTDQIISPNSRKRRYTLQDSSDEDIIDSGCCKRKSKQRILSSDSDLESDVTMDIKPKICQRKRKTYENNRSARNFFKDDREERLVEFIDDEDFICDGDNGKEKGAKIKHRSKILSSLEEVEEKNTKKMRNRKLKELLQKKAYKKTRNTSRSKTNKIEDSSEESSSEESEVGSSNFIDDTNEELSSSAKSDQDEECEEEEINGSESSEPYEPNPILERDDKCDKADIMLLLSRKTQCDEENKNRYMKQLGKYQLQPHSTTNRAIYTSESKRYNRHMWGTNFDISFKQDRGLNHNDEEYYGWVQLNVCGDRIKVREYAKPFKSLYDNYCPLKNCKKQIVAGVSLIIPCMIFDRISKDFVKRVRQNGTQAMFYICKDHYSNILGGDDDSYSCVSDWSEGNQDCQIMSGESDDSSDEDDQCSSTNIDTNNE